MKLLENKYIDLANFYKEMMTTEQQSTRKLVLSMADKQKV